MIVYHGTNADNLQSIIDNGLLSCPPNRIWTVSEDAVYFYGEAYLLSEYGEDYLENGSRQDILVRVAAEQAMTTLGKAKDCRICVVEFQVDDDDIEVDQSCPNMEFASCVPYDVPPNKIKRIFVSQDLSLIRGYFIGMMAERDLSALEFSDFEIEVGRRMRNLEFYLEEMVTWTIITP